MKRLFLLCVLLSFVLVGILIAVMGCNDYGIQQSSNGEVIDANGGDDVLSPLLETYIAVENYVNALKANQYEDRDLPVFTYEHIDELLKYRDNTNVVTRFPYSPVSSFYQGECMLGVYILWTIEYIRVKSVGEELLVVGSFPSMNPLLKLRDSEGVGLVDETMAHQVVSNAYFTWWTNNKDRSLLERMEIDPLRNTVYTWWY